MTGRLRVGVAGGGIGTQHIEAFLNLPELFELVAFCDIDPARAAAVAGRYGIPVVVGSLEALLAVDGLDLVDICTPASLHAAQTEAALRAGRHVICEKPLAGSLAEIDALIALERATGRTICPIFQYRFGNGLQKLLHLRATGVLGRAFLTTIETHWRRERSYYDVPWRGRWATELGGCLVSHAIHAHDMLTLALGPVAAVHARTRTLVNPIETEDTAVLSLAMADGSLAALSVTLGAAREHSRLRFCFERATVESNYAAYRPHLEPWTILPMDEAAAAAIDDALLGFVPGVEHFAGQLARLHAALHGRGPLPVTSAEARQAIELATAAYASAATGREQTLPLGKDHQFYRGWTPRSPAGG